MKHLKALWKLRRLLRFPAGEARFNALAAMVCLLALGMLMLSFHTKPADAGLGSSALGPQTASLSAGPVSDDAGAGRGMSATELRQRLHGAVHSSRLALELHVAMLELGRQRLQATPDYQATFIRQERLEGGTLLDLQTMELKIRHTPLSIYLKWMEGGDVGRELLYVDGQNDNRMLVKLGGGKKLLPAVKVDPEGSLAMSEARHPVTSAGLMHLCDKVLSFRRQDLRAKSGVRWQMIPDQKFGNRACHCFVVEYDSPQVEPIYRKSLTFVDQELSLPVCVKAFTWPAEGTKSDDPQQLDDATLVEYYAYTDVHLERRLTDADFDKANADYKFRR